MRKTSIYTIFLFLPVFLLILNTVMIGSFWAYSELHVFQRTSREKKAELIASRKTLIKGEVNRVIEYINHNRSQARRRLTQSIRQRVYEAHAIAESIWKQNQTTASEEQIQKMIIDALRPIRFNDGRGYYFILSNEGVVRLMAHRPGLEGDTLDKVVSVQGRPIGSDMLQIVKDKGEGFYEYQMTKPGEEGRGHPKIAFVKRFAPLKWMIGTGEYLQDVEKDIQKEVLAYIEKIRFGEEGYIFIDSHALRNVMHPFRKGLTGTYVGDLKDAKGNYFSREIYKAGQQEGGGFVTYYTTIKPTISPWGKPAEKLTFARSVDDWKWTLGAGVYVSDIDADIAAQRSELVEYLWKRLGAVLVGLLVLLALTIAVAGFFLTRARRDIKAFSAFFNRAATEAIEIQADDLAFSEFRHLSQMANRMVAERNRIDQQLQQTTQYLNNVVDSMPSLLIGVDQKGRVTQWNLQAEKATGIRSKEAQGKLLHEAIPVLAEEEQRVISAVQEGAIKRRENVPVDFGPQHNIADITVYPLVANGVKGAVIRIDDVTAQHALQERLQHSNKMEAIGQLAGGVAHDFNNLLTPILGNAQLLSLNLSRQSKEAQLAREIEQAATRASDLTRQLLAFSRKGQLQTVSTDVHRIIDEVISLLKHSIDKRIEIKRDLSASCSIVMGDPTQLQNALLNLGVNARDAMPEGGELTLATRNVTVNQQYCSSHPGEIIPGEYVEIDVSDTGTGMPPELKERIFEPFFTTKKAGEGTGLGLASVYGCIQAHHGLITVYSEPNVGSTFKLLLPTTEATESHARQVETKAPQRGQGRLLVVDDEEIVRNFAARVLLNLGYSVTTCSDGQHAVEFYEKNYKTVDLVILDLIMPRLGGMETFQKLKEINPSVRVIVASGFSHNRAVSAILESGALGFLSKPFSIDELSAAVAHHITPDKPNQQDAS